MGGHIFISYRNLYDEPQFALRLAAELKNSGIPAWIDKMDIQPSDDWYDAIEHGINACQAMIAVISPDYLKSSHCKEELKRARRLERPIFPVLLRDVPAEDWPIQAETIQYVDFRDWLNDSAYRAGVEKLIGTIRQKLANAAVPIPDAETQYLNRLIAELETRKGVLEYVELSAQMDEPVRPKPRISDEWGLEGAYALLEVPSLTPPPNPLPEFREGEYGREAKKIPLESIREAVAKHPRFVLIGDPGAGKTTTLRRLALDAARERQKNAAAPLPLLLYLPQWGEETGPADFVQGQMEKAGLQPLPLTPSSHRDSLRSPYTERGKNTGESVVLYLDGLNEMGAAGAEKAKKLREWLAGTDAPGRVIVTCRVGDYAGDLDLKLPTVLAQPMDETRVQEFVGKYLRDEAEKFLGRVRPHPLTPSPNSGRGNEDRSLWRLAMNPYLLTALMVVFKSSPEGDLPRNNGALFRRLAMALWERERLRQTPGWISFEQMEERFGKLAFAMIDENTPIDVPREYALKHLDDESLLRAGASANFVEVRGDEVRFYHQLMLEYFAAVELQYFNILNKLKSPTFFSSINPHRASDKWDQVFIALCGLVSDPNDIISKVALRDPFLAADCVQSGIVTSNDCRQSVAIQLLRGSHNSVNSVTANALKKVGKITVWDSDISTLLLSSLKSNDAWIRGFAARELSNFGMIAVAELLEALHDLDNEVRVSAVNSLGKLKSKDAIPSLIALLQDSVSEVRKTAMRALVEYGLETIPLLLDALTHYHFRMRQSAAEVLGCIGSPEAVPALLKALQDSHWSVRYEAAKALGKIGLPALVGLTEKLEETEETEKDYLGTPVSIYAAQGLEIMNVPEARQIVTRWWTKQLSNMEEIRLPEPLALGLRWRNSFAEMAVFTLKRIGTPEALEAVRRWREEQGKKD